MKNLSLILIYLLVIVAKLLGPGGVKGIIAENLLLKLSFPKTHIWHYQAAIRS